MSREAKQPRKEHKDRGTVELAFSLAVGKEPPRPFVLRGTNIELTLGRNPESNFVLNKRCVSYKHCVFFLKRKGRDPVLHVKDQSKNMTGVRHLNRPWKELRYGESEALQHRSQVQVPLLAGRDELKRTTVTVLFSLPDAYCPLQRRGRWHYAERLGEGGLAVVYRATDMEKGLGNVAVKVSKFSNLPSASPQNRHIYALHREARWSIDRLHNDGDRRHHSEGALLFARYLEDHTGYWTQSGADFDALRSHFESPEFSWATYHFDPPLPSQPYVVMELIDGKLLQSLIEGSPPLTTEEKREITRQCCEALVYMERFGAMHRDFRGCNVFLKGRGQGCQVKVIDLGFMISGEAIQVKNPNAAVRCAWQGEPERKVRFDWAPPEVRLKGAPNFAIPGCSFDVYSLGVLFLKLLRGRSWAQEVLESQDLQQIAEAAADLEALGLDAVLLQQMLGPAEGRPLPQCIHEAMTLKLPGLLHECPCALADTPVARLVEAGSATGHDLERSPALLPPVPISMPSLPRSRSRSRSRQGPRSTPRTPTKPKAVPFATKPKVGLPMPPAK